MIRRLLTIIVLALPGCEILPVSVDPYQLPQPDKPLVFEFSYVNSTTLPGWIRFRNHCSGIVSYEWHFGFYHPDGKEATSFNAAPKVKYPNNGIFSVKVSGVAHDSTKFQQALAIEVTNY